VVLRRPAGSSTWSTAAKVVSAADGAVTWSSTATSADWQLRYDGGPALTNSIGAVTPAPVATSVSVTASATRLSYGGFLTLSGAVGPSHAGQPVYVDLLTATGWVQGSSQLLSSSSAYSMRVKVATRGTLSYRIRKPADVDHAVGTSGTVVVTVV
jgi:hypothetical protein